MRINMKNLSEFKKFLAANIDNSSVKLSSIATYHGKEIINNPPATIGLVQSNSFALNRVKGLSWFDFGKAGNWCFTSNEAIHTTMSGGIMTFTIHKN
jgi:hypothetical protein